MWHFRGDPKALQSKDFESEGVANPKCEGHAFRELANVERDGARVSTSAGASQTGGFQVEGANTGVGFARVQTGAGQYICKYARGNEPRSESDSSKGNGSRS